MLIPRDLGWDSRGGAETCLAPGPSYPNEVDVHQSSRSLQSVSLIAYSYHNGQISGLPNYDLPGSLGAMSAWENHLSLVSLVLQIVPRNLRGPSTRQSLDYAVAVDVRCLCTQRKRGRTYLYGSPATSYVFAMRCNLIEHILRISSSL